MCWLCNCGYIFFADYACKQTSKPSLSFYEADYDRCPIFKKAMIQQNKMFIHSSQAVINQTCHSLFALGIYQANTRICAYLGFNSFHFLSNCDAVKNPTGHHRYYNVCLKNPAWNYQNIITWNFYGHRMSWDVAVLIKCHFDSLQPVCWCSIFQLV